MSKKINRKKINFMINYDIIKLMNSFIPLGKRSDFVNESLTEAFSLLKRKIACKKMDKTTDLINLNVTTEEFIKEKNYGRL